MTFFHSFLLGIVEGLTEFLPISSTGHQILVSHLLWLAQTEELKLFEVCIQIGAIAAVGLLYLRKVWQTPRLALLALIGFLPTGAAGFLLYKTVKSLFAPESVAIMLIAGGVVFVLAERFYFRHREEPVDAVETVSVKQALLLWTAQTLAMIPGTSRSGVTILAGMFAGLSRRTASEFSFLLALPTLGAAAGYDLLKNASLITSDMLISLTIGSIAAFGAALLSVHFFLTLVKWYGLTPFGWYRIFIGFVLLFWIF